MIFLILFQKGCVSIGCNYNKIIIIRNIYKLLLSSLAFRRLAMANDPAYQREQPGLPPTQTLKSGRGLPLGQPLACAAAALLGC